MQVVSTSELHEYWYEENNCIPSNEYIERRHGEPFKFLFPPKMGLLGSQAVIEKKVQFWIMSNFLAPFFQLFMGKNLFF
jgi:hypothetical protein